MNRKVKAYIEFQSVEPGSEEDLSLSNQFSFSPCEVISCFYEYPVRCIPFVY